MDWLKRELWGSRRRRIASVTLALLLALVAVGGIAEALGGGSTSSTPVAGATEAEPTNPEPTPAGAACTTGPANHNMRATFYGVGPQACTRLNQEVAKESGEFWRVVPPGSYVEGSDLVCSMTQGGELIEIRDTGEHDYGNRFCASLTAKGWVEKEGPGVKIERERKQREAQERSEREQRETEEHERQQRKEEAERKKEEATQKVENERQERESKEQLEQSERENREQERKNEEETRRSEREAQSQ